MVTEKWESDALKREMGNKPYLETKIITYINPEKKDFDVVDIYYSDKPLQDINWQMKENLERIKLPCWCTFKWRGKRRLGMIQNILERTQHQDYSPLYELHEIDKQTHQKIGSRISYNFSLPGLIIKYKVNIGKVKITYYETI